MEFLEGDEVREIAEVLEDFGKGWVDEAGGCAQREERGSLV